MTADDPLRVRRPCQKPWSELVAEPSGTSRWCETCRRSVVDTTKLTARETKRRLASLGGHACIRTVHDASGRTVHRRSWVRRVSTAFAGTFTALLAACGGDASGSNHESTHAEESAAHSRSDPITPLDDSTRVEWLDVVDTDDEEAWLRRRWRARTGETQTGETREASVQELTVERRRIEEALRLELRSQKIQGLGYF